MTLRITHIQHIPQEPGIYIFKDKTGGVLYIGKAKNLHKRVQQYFTPGSVRKQEMLVKAHTVESMSVANESEALYLESNLIKKYQPPYNSLLKGDNNYCFIKITKEDFPQILVTRQRKDDGAIYIGPKHQRHIVKEFLHYLRQILQFRVSKPSEFNKGKLGSDFYFGLDRGRSVIAKLKQKNAQQYIDEAKKHGLVLNKNYDDYKKEYKDIVYKIVSFFQGNTRAIEKDIRSKIQDAIDKQHFEWAAKLRDIYTKIDALTERQRVVVESNLNGFLGIMKQMSGWTVYVIFTLYEGRIIDVFRHKQKSDDLDIAAFVANVENAYGSAQWYHNIQGSVHNFAVGDTVTGTLFFIDQNIKKIKNQTFDELQKLLQKTLDDFVQVSSFEKESLMNDILKTLEHKYSLAQFPYRIECIDISHLSGGWMSGGLSCLLGGVPFPKGYRRYKIKSIKTLDQQNNDYKALEEVLLRRYTKTDTADIPNICIIDGGKGQLGVVQKLLTDNKKFRTACKDIQFVSLGKGDARKRKGKNMGASEELLVLRNKDIKTHTLQYDDSDRILIKARDEAHRFANAYRKKQMSQEWK